MLALVLETAQTFPAWAQDQVPGAEERQDAPAAADGEAESSDGPLPSRTDRGAESPRGQPRFLPPVLRPKVLTPEELEEAERLKRLAAKYGTDPTAIVGRVQFSTQYQDLPQGAKLVDSTVRVDLPFRGNWILRVDAPFNRYADPNRQGTGSQNGLSDLSVTAGWRLYNTPEYAFLLGTTSTFPTAVDNGLGSGKYTVGPLIATARFLPRWESFLFGVFQHLVSVGGDPSRRDISLSRIVAQVNSIWAERWWTIGQSVLQIDCQRNEKSSMALEFEVGRNFAGRWGIYGRPGIGLWGRDVAGAYNWNIEVGIRRIFSSF